MTMDDELVLIEKTSAGKNDLGDPITTETRTTILCSVQSVKRSEHYAAAAHGLQPEIIFVVNQYEYAGEKDIEYSGNKYRVIRTYQPDKAKSMADFETIELICQGVH